MSYTEIVIPEARSSRHFFKGQTAHLVALALLLTAAWVLAAPEMGDGSWLGITDEIWFWLAVGLTVLQQVLGWLVFRVQLGWGTITRWFGSYDILIWGSIFIPLLLVRPVLVLGLSIADRASLTLPESLTFALGLSLMVPALYTFWSVGRYFGLQRALGGDHFRIQFRQMPLVRQGAFRFSSNAMYSFAFLALWSIALFLRSRAGLLLALFEHVYVWVHFFATEEPDMRLLYGTNLEGEDSH